MTRHAHFAHLGPAGLATLATLAALTLVAAGGGAPPAKPAEQKLTPDQRRELLFEHRNLGKALYENPATQYQAVGELEKALELAPDSARDRVNLGLALLRAAKTDEGIAQLQKAQRQDPSIPHTWFNLGIAYKRQSKYAEAITQLEGMARRVPDEPITWYNLGVLYKLQGQPEKSLAAFERAARLDPDLAGPHFQLAAAYRRAGRADDATREMKAFREIKERSAKAASPEDLEWSWYSELYETREPEAFPTPEARPSFAAEAVASGLDPATAGLAVLDGDGDGAADLLAWSAKGVRLLAGGKHLEDAGLGNLHGVTALAAGDFDNDGLPDLAVATGDGVVLLANQKGAFAPHPWGPMGGGLDEILHRPYTALLWLDYDRDYDQDLLLLGDRPALLRNDGDGTFSDHTADFPFVAGHPLAVRRFHMVADHQGLDLAVTYADRPGVLYRDHLGGRYEAVPLAALPAGARRLVASDFDHDGEVDLAAAGTFGVTLLENDGHEGFTARPVDGLAGAAAAPAGLVAIDPEDRGVSDLVAGDALLRNRGKGRFEADGRAFPADSNDSANSADSAGSAESGVRALEAADFDGDGRQDLAAVTDSGDVVLLTNRTKTGNGFLRVSLAGIKNPKLAPGALVEVKAGTLYQKKPYRGVPLVFGLDGHETADTVRITWPNGLIQNETRQAAGTSPVYKEAQRLSGSCPMIFTWSGEGKGHGFRFITDVLGVAPLGASSGDGEYFPVDHDETIQVPGDALAVTPDGRYEVRIVEELREVAFLDQVRLVAVDHPAGLDVFVNSKFKGPPFPEHRLFGVGRRLYPVTAVDGRGRDVRGRILARDATYPDGFRRDYDGLAELHHLDLDFGKDAAPDNRAILVLDGWVDWADGSTFLATAQSRSHGGGPGLVLPYLQVQDASGRWVTVIQDMGLPAGKPKTIVVDLTGKFLSASRKVRIVTSACVYWDQIFLGEDPSPPRVTESDVALETADLHFYGFSRVLVDPERKQPERFVYAEHRPAEHWSWNPTPGLYTRYGDVASLLAGIDDRMVVMGSGDEIRLSFDARSLPPLRAGWKRDFLLLVDGWAKDRDANTAFGQSVEPLPFHAMSQYPYPPDEHFPDDPAHTLYRERYLTRPALRLVRPLTEGLAPAGGGAP